MQKAKKNIYFAMFALTNRDFIDLLKNVSKNNIVINGIVDQEQIYNSREILFDLMNFRDIHIKAIGTRDSRMHHKFIIIDEHIAITGSFNWTYQANLRNSENIVFVNDKDIASKFIDEYRRSENKINKTFDPATIYKFEDEDINNLLLSGFKNNDLESDETSINKNTLIYYDEDGKEYVKKINSKDVISYLDEDEKGNRLKTIVLSRVRLTLFRQGVEDG